MELTPHLVFSGNAAEVLDHYRAALGGEVEIVRYAGTPAGEGAPQLADKVLYGTLRSPYGTVHVMDAPPDRCGEPGDNFVLGVRTDTEGQTDEIYARLLAGGSVVMPLEKTFWSQKFGMCTDKFGIKWMVSWN